MTFANPLAEGFTRGLAGRFARKGLQDAFHSRGFSSFAHIPAAPVFFKAHGLFRQIARNLFHVATDIADLGKFCRLDLDEGGVGKLRQAAADFGFTATRGSDHQDVFRRDFIAQVRTQPLAPPTVTQRDSDGFFGVGLTDDMLVKGSHNGFRC